MQPIEGNITYKEEQWMIYCEVVWHCVYWCDHFNCQ